MTTTGVRPKGSSGPMYHPERDLAYITPTLMAQAMSTLVIANMRPELQKFAEEHNVTQEDLNWAVVQFAEAQQHYVSLVNPVESAHEALSNKQFFNASLATRLLLTAAIGEAVTGAWFVAVRDVTRVDQDSPAITQMAEMLNAARQVAGTNIVWAPDALAAKLTELEQKVENRDAWLRDEKKATAAAKKRLDDLSVKIGWWITRPFMLRLKHWWNGYTFIEHANS